MFSKVSRYRKLEDVTIVDAAGFARASKELRTGVTVDGKFRHTVADGDRADHLAYKYYKQPRKWWRICDANPEFMSPQALLGKDTVASARFPVTIAGTPPWAAILAALATQVGIEDAKLDMGVTLVPEEQTINNQIVTVNVEHVAYALVVTFNCANLVVGDIAAVIAAAGFEVGEPQLIGRAGKQIVIPPDTGTARS